MTSDKPYTSIDEVRAKFYPEGAELLEVGRDIVLQFPEAMTAENSDLPERRTTTRRSTTKRQKNRRGGGG